MTGPRESVTSNEFLARALGNRTQSLEAHLEEVASFGGQFASKIGLGRAGELIGLLHDFGKYSSSFQNYLKAAVELLDPDEDEEIPDSKRLKGKIDHSTAGAQLVWRELSNKGPFDQIAAQILALCIASHHSGLIDCLASSASGPIMDNFSRRIEKPDERTHLEEALSKANAAILNRALHMLRDATLVKSLEERLRRIDQGAADGKHRRPSETVAQFQIGLLVRLLFSCLIDADRISSADFENAAGHRHRSHGRYTGWPGLIDRLESHLSNMVSKSPIDDLRKETSSHCREASARPKSVYTLTVPTGGGKTLASLRFALHHAQAHGMERVVYVVPFTSIIDQNADVARSILEPTIAPNERGRIVLEHHSNIAPEVQSWKEKILTENWDAPVVYTTSVQFLEALFGGGTRGARRMHQLVNAVIVFDEIQTLPVRCVHLFNNAINFLVENCGSTVVLCSATQPLLDKVDAVKGRLSASAEIIPHVQRLFRTMRRVNVEDRRKSEGWELGEIADLAVRELGDSGSCLLIVNTKNAARKLYQKLKLKGPFPLFHLSTNMCPVHRKSVLKKVREHLDFHEPVLCVSTQLIEAGVDVDFGSVIRFSAGLDSIAQAAGRCNRHGKRETGRVHVVNLRGENLDKLRDIRIGRECASRVLNDFTENPDLFDNDRIGPKAMEWYYRNYFFARAQEMDYPVNGENVGRDDTLLNLLSMNTLARDDYKRTHHQAPTIFLRQSFSSASKAFRAIDAPTEGVIVPYGREGVELVAGLQAAHDVERQWALLRQAQQYTVSLFRYDLDRLLDQGALTGIQQGSRIYALDRRYYDENFGLIPDVEQELLYAGT